MAITINGTTGITLPSGSAAVGTTDTQTLTNKTVGSGYAGSTLTQGTAQNSTSGTSIDFTGIPSWAKRVTILFNEVSTNAANAYLIRIGNSGGFQTTGYISSSGHFNFVNATGGQNNTTGFVLQGSAAGQTTSGEIKLTNLSGTLWVYSAVFKSDVGLVGVGAGTANITGLDRVRITSTTGTDTFDNGSINIMWE